MLTIGELSKSTGTNVSTIRYYEQMGLLTHSSRSEGNQRRYSSAERERLSFIRQARDLGLTIEAIRELIDLGQRPDMSKSDVERITAEQLVTVRGKVERLKMLEAELVRISAQEELSVAEERRVIQSLAEPATPAASDNLGQLNPSDILIRNGKINRNR